MNTNQTHKHINERKFVIITYHYIGFTFVLVINNLIIADIYVLSISSFISIMSTLYKSKSTNCFVGPL